MSEVITTAEIIAALPIGIVLGLAFGALGILFALWVGLLVTRRNYQREVKRADRYYDDYVRLSRERR